MRMLPETPGVVAIEFTAVPKKPQFINSHGEIVRPPTPKPFNTEAVMPIGKWPERAPWYVSLDGHPYAGFYTKETAQEAAKLWAGYVDGLGRPVTERAGVTWPGCEHRVIRVERGSK
jgi:hypothetical protein